MSIWKFEIRQSGKERVQTVGMRPFIVSFMLERGIGRGDAVNSTDGKRVSVFLECADRKTAVGFRRMLASVVRSEAKSAYSNLPLKFKLSALEKENHNSSNVPLLSDKALATTLSQTSKGVGAIVAMNGVMVAMHRDISGLHSETRNGFGSLRSETRNGFGSLRKEMHDGFGKLDRRLDKLPEKIAKAFRGAL